MCTQYDCHATDIRQSFKGRGQNIIVLHESSKSSSKTRILVISTQMNGRRVQCSTFSGTYYMYIRKKKFRYNMNMNFDLYQRDILSRIIRWSFFNEVKVISFIRLQFTERRCKLPDYYFDILSRSVIAFIPKMARMIGEAADTNLKFYGVTRHGIDHKTVHIRISSLKFQ